MLIEEKRVDPNSPNENGMPLWLTLIPTQKFLLDICFGIAEYLLQVCDVPANTEATLLWYILDPDHVGGPSESSGEKNRSPLAHAAHHHDLRMIELLLKHGADVHNGGAMCVSPIARAFEGGNQFPAKTERTIQTMEVLLKHGADADDALLCVAQGNPQQGNDNISDADPYLEFLLANYANPNAVTDKNSSVNKSALASLGASPTTPLGTSALMIASLGQSAVRVNMLLKKGADCNLVNVRGDTALSLAVGEIIMPGFYQYRREPVEVVNLLLQSGADPNHVFPSDDEPITETILMRAIRNNFSSVGKALLEKGADPNYFCGRGGIKYAPLGRVLLDVVEKNSRSTKSFFEMLMDHNADIHQPATLMVNGASQSHTVLYLALRHHAVPVVVGMVERLLAAGALLTGAGIPLANAETIASNKVVLSPELSKVFVMGSNSETFGGGLRGKQLWLACALKHAVGPTPNANTLELNVQRGNMLDGLCEQFGIDEASGEVDGAVARAQGLNVRFQGENGTGDGLRREWFHSATAELTDMRRGLFLSKDGGRTLQPNPESEVAAGGDHLSYFALLARIAGFALFHRETIHVPWSTAFIKAVFGFPIAPKDLESVNPDLYEAKVVYLRDSVYVSKHGMKIEDLDMTFEDVPVLEEYSAKRQKMASVALKEGGAEIAVNEENKNEFLQLFVENRLLGSIRPQIDAFRGGLAVFFNEEMLAKLRVECRPIDIKLLLCGAPVIDVDDWEASAEYSGGFSADSEQVGWFWLVVRGMNEEERARVLDFCTGSACPPATGFHFLMGYSGQQQRFKLQLVVGGENRLPTAATCFNTLRMPIYSSAEQLKAKLGVAMDGAEGFDEGAVAE